MSEFQDLLAQTPPADRVQAVITHVGDVATRLLGDPNLEIDPDRPFTDYGYSSLVAVELARILCETTGLDLPAIILFEHPTPRAVAVHVVTSLGYSADTEPAAAVSPAVESRAGEASLDDDIAIVGMSCRYPGSVDTPSELWDLVAGGVDAVGPFPRDRGWDLDALYNPDPDVPRTTYVREAGFLDDISGFDAAFFHISPKEAMATDPQQRLLLEGAWEAMERAGLDIAGLRGSATGVFVGASPTDYVWLASSGPAEIEGFWGIGTTGSVASGRISYVFGLEGPTLTVDTACSSSLVAMHLARQSLQAGECSLALAGGVALTSTPSMWREFSRHRVLAADGRCRSFSADATGTGWGEGMGMVVLERVADARAAGHAILGVLRGSAVNHDGASNGLTAPRGSAQEQVIRDALASAGLDPADVDAVEAHGTGTTLGDPIEARALQSVYGSAHSADEPLYLGSLKSNISHCQAAAGVGGLQKMILALEHERLPRTLHVSAPTPVVDWDSGSMRLLTEEVPWTRGRRPRRAGISAFGIGGTNAHIIVEEPPVDAPDRSDASSSHPVVWPLSARDNRALRARARRLADVVAAAGDALDIAAVAAATERSDQGMSFRAAVVGDDPEQLRAQLERIADDADVPKVTRNRKVAFVFPGQATQLDETVVGLLDGAPAFAAAFAECAHALAAHRDDWDDATVEDILRGRSRVHRIDDADVIPPILFATYVAIAALWRSYGLVPEAVVGHSQGEIAAAHVAGIVSLDDAALIVMTRTRLVAHLAESTGLLAVAEGEGPAGRRVTGETEVVVAAANGPGSSVLAGPRVELDRLQADYEREGVRARHVGAFASHSAFVEPYKTPLIASLARLSPRTTDTRFCSAVTANFLDGGALGPDYWYRNLRSKVRFEEATVRLLDNGIDTFLEMSPRAVLSSSIAETIDQHTGAQTAVAIGASKGPAPATELLRAVARAWECGIEVAWPRVPATGATVAVPTYPFERQRYWIDLPTGFDSGSAAGFPIDSIDHPIITGRLDIDSDGRSMWTGTLSRARHPWLTDHSVCGAVLAPAVVFLEIAATVADHLGIDVVDELVVTSPLPIPEERDVQIRLIVGELHPDGSRAFTVDSRSSELGASQVRHVEGRFGAPGAPTSTATEWDDRVWPPPQGRPLDVTEMYQAFDRAGVGYGIAFRGCARVWESSTDDGVRYAEVDDRTGQPDQRYTIAHPAVMDAAFHPALAAGHRDSNTTERVLLPFSWTGVRWTPGTGSRGLRVRTVARGPLEVATSAVDETGRPVLTVDAVAARPVDQTAIAQLAAVELSGLYRTVWTTAPPDPRPVWERVSVVGADEPAGRGPSESEAIQTGSGRTLTILDRRGFAGGPGDVSERLASVGESIVRWVAGASEQAHLTVVTQGAVAVDDHERPNPESAALWGFLTSAAAEWRGRLSVIDLGHADPIEGAADAAGLEPAGAVRAGRTLVPRIVPVRGDPTLTPRAIDPESAVLISGGTSGIGAAIARHLAAAHGVRRLILVSRSGESAPGAAQLIGELSTAGCESIAIGADVSDVDTLGCALSGVHWPIAGIVHSAGVLDDSTVADMTAAQLSRVLQPKVGGINALETVCADQPIQFVVSMSSIAGTVGASGQGNYAAANAYLDAHALQSGRETSVVSIAWGLWEMDTGMSRTVDIERLRRGGLLSLDTSTAMSLFDLALAGATPAAVIAAAIDRPTLIAAMREGVVSPILSQLAQSGATERSERRDRSKAAPPQLSSLLARSEPKDRQKLVIDAIASEVAAVLRYDDGSAVRGDELFKDMGLDSLGAVELRNRIARLVGSPLPISIAFDHPTPARLADYLIDLVAEAEPRERAKRVDDALGGLRSVLAELDAADREKALPRIAALIRETDTRDERDSQNPDLSDLFDFIDQDLGVQ